MAKKGKSDEKVQAEAGPLAGEPPVAQTGGAPGVETVVDGDGDAAAGAGGTEQPDGEESAGTGTATAAVGETAGADHVDGASDAALEEGRLAAVPDAPADGAVSKGVSDDEDDGDGSASGVAVDIPADMIIEAAKAAANEALRFVVAYWMLPDATMAQCHVLFGAYSTAAPAMAELVRKIGTERATLEVVASQLKILGYIDDVDLHPAVRMAITVFLQVLVAIEAFEAEGFRALQDAARAKTMAERKPLPIEDTTLEPVSGPLETWGGA